MKQTTIPIIALLSLCACEKQADQKASQAARAPSVTNSATATLDGGALAGLCIQTAEANVDSVKKSLHYMDTVLPNVPPEEAEYLQREKAAAEELTEQETTANAPHAQSNARYAALSGRPLYSVWEARKYLADAIVAVDNIYEPQSGAKLFTEGKTTVHPEAIRLRRDKADALLRMLNAADYIDRVAGSVREFTTAHEFRRSHLLTDDQWGRVYFAALQLPGSLQRAMRCQLAHIVLEPPEQPATTP